MAEAGAARSDLHAPKPTLYELFRRASDQHPDCKAARVARFQELAREYGYVGPGSPTTLPCGWPRSMERPRA